MTINGQPASVDGQNRFTGVVPVIPGTTTVTINAVDPSGNASEAIYEVDQAGTSKTFTYDANGNMTSDGTRTFEWDARNQLVAVNVGTHRSEFGYDGLQRRVREIEKESGLPQSDTNVLWCENAICDERGADGSTVLRRALAHGEQVGGASRFFATDHLASVRDVTDASVTLLARYAFDAWGRRTLAAGADVTTVGFTGHRNHGPSSLAMTLYRGYDPGLGRWVSEDPVNTAGGINLYAYSGSGPTNRVDREGLFPLVPDWIFLSEFVEGSRAMWRNYKRMQQRGWKRSDKYYHCMANCQATNGGSGGAAAAAMISFFRTNVRSRWTESTDWQEDAKANRCGQQGGDCDKVCSSYVPPSSPGRPPFPGW